MRNLIALIVRFGSLISFLFLELVCFFLIINFNPIQRDIYLNSSNLLSGSILQQRNKINEYLALEETNESLQDENANLKEEILLLKGFENSPIVDTSLQYKLKPASVIKQDYRLRNNHLTLNKGINQGVKKDMGVISKDGLVGIIKGTSNKYSRAISILNMETRISAQIKNTNHFGNLVWKGSDPQFVTLETIPRYANIAKGDTIITSGYSTIFPLGINVGKIESFEIEEGTSFYSIKVKLDTDMTSLRQVYIIENKHKVEIDSLETTDE